MGFHGAKKDQKEKKILSSKRVPYSTDSLIGQE